MKQEDPDFIRFFGVCDLDEWAVKVKEAFKVSDKGRLNTRVLEEQFDFCKHIRLCF